MGECIVPAVFVQRAVFNGSYGFLPIVTGFQIGSFDNATTGKAEHAWIQIGQRLCQVFTHAVLAFLPGIDGEQGYVFEVQ